MKPSPRRDGEDARSYIQRLEWEKSRIPQDLLHAPMRGYVATPDGLKHWTRATVLGPSGVASATPAMAEELGSEINPRYTAPVFHTFAPPAPIVRRSGQARLEELSKMLLSFAKESVKDGVLRLPRSVMDEIVKTYQQMGIHKTPEDIERESLDGIRLALDEWAKRMLTQTQRQIGIDSVPAIQGGK